MAQSEYTKQCRQKLWIARITDWVILFVPLFGYIVKALADGGVTTTGKVTVVATVLIALILTVFNIFLHRELHCVIWIAIIGLFVAIRDQLLPLIVMLGAASIADELIFRPMIGHMKVELISSKTYDKREEAQQVQSTE